MKNLTLKTLVGVLAVLICSSSYSKDLKDSKNTKEYFYNVASSCGAKGQWKFFKEKQKFTENEIVKIATTVEVLQNQKKVSMTHASCAGDWTIQDDYKFNASGKVLELTRHHSTFQNRLSKNGVKISTKYSFTDKLENQIENVEIVDLKTQAKLDMPKEKFYRKIPLSIFKHYNMLPHHKAKK